MKSRRYFGRLGIVLVLAQLLLLVSGQDCLAGGRVPPFKRANGSYSLPNNAQAIITSYEFICCGNITTWQTYVVPRRRIFQVITFQVWRPSPTVQETGCYSLVGENRFTSILPGRRGLVSETPQPSNILIVQPGDVVGYNISGSSKGIQLDAETNINSVWYHTDTDSELPVIEASKCPYPVGTEVGRTLKSSTDAAPVLSVGVSSFPCPSTFTTSSPSSLLPRSLIATTTSVPIQDSATIPQLLPTNIPPTSPFITSPVLSTSTSSSPVSSLAPSTSSAALSTAATVSVAVGCAFLFTLLCTLALAITLAKIRYKRQKTVAETSTVVTNQNGYCMTQIDKTDKDMNMHKNEAYSPTYHVIDELCGSQTNTDYDPVYESLNIGNEDYDYAEEPHYYT